MSTTFTEFSQLMLRIYRHAQSQPVNDFQEAVLEELKGSVAFDSGMWGTATVGPGGIDVHSIHLHRSSQAMLDAYELVKHEDQAAQIVSRQPRCTMAFNSDEINVGPERAGVHRLCAEFGHQNILITSDFNTMTRFGQWISLYRRDAAQLYSPQELSLVSELAQHLMQALSINRLVHLDRMVGDVRAQWSVAIADMRGVLYHADKAFVRLVGTEWAAGTAGQLPPTLLDGLIGDETRVVGQKVVVQRSVERDVLFLKARPRHAVDSLSSRELVVARMLTQGLTRKEAAQRLGRSLETVNTQVKTVFEKLGISNAVVLGAQLALRE